MRNDHLTVVLISLAAGCMVDSPSIAESPDAAPAPDGPVAADAAGDAAPPAEAYAVSGRTLDYFTQAPLASSSLDSEGLAPPLTGSSDAAGDFNLMVPAGSVFVLSAYRAAYRVTRNAPISIADQAIVHDLHLASSADVQRQYASVGQAVTGGNAAVFAELVRSNGTPLIDVPLADVALVDGLDAPPVGVNGPYFFGAAGDLDPAVLTATAYGGRSRVGFLDCPPGNFRLKVTYLAGGGGGAGDGGSFDIPVTCTADGVTLARTGEPGSGGGGGGPTTFTQSIYPRLQRPAIDELGRACANCHTAGGQAAIAPFDGSPADVHALLLTRPGVVNLGIPAESLLLLNPLYEIPPALPNHPNATFLDVTDPDYLLILDWITLGAPL